MPIQGRPPMPLPRSGASGITTAQIKRYKNAEPWIYYDTRVFSANTVPPDTGAFNFAQFTNPLPFFNARNIGNAGLALTNMSDSQKMDNDFICKRITVDVLCDMAAPAAANNPTAPAFVETVVHQCVLSISFGTDVKYVSPIVKLPSGGGVVIGALLRTQAAAANSDQGPANNGMQDRRAVRDMDEPILFKEGSAFTCQLITNTAATLAKLVAIQALTGNFQAVIRVNLEGVRGKGLLKGTPAGPQFA